MDPEDEEGICIIDDDDDDKPEEVPLEKTAPDKESSPERAPPSPQVEQHQPEPQEDGLPPEDWSGWQLEDQGSGGEEKEDRLHSSNPELNGSDRQDVESNLSQDKQSEDNLSQSKCPSEVQEEEPVVKKRRGKKKKAIPAPVFLPLPPKAIAGCSEEVADELQEAYRILQVITAISNIHPFVDRPNENLYGMSSYYNIIEKPMWLNEVERKLLGGEYNGMVPFVADVRLILENCYRFWGPTHKFTRKALFIEHKLESQLEKLQEPLKSKCAEAGFEMYNCEVPPKIGKNDYEDFGSYQMKNRPIGTTLLKGFESRILNKVLESEDMDSEDVEEQKKKEVEMLAWEQEHLVSEDNRKLIKSLWQLAEIGTFLKLTCEVLNVEEISQYEVERMLLMPIESSTLATLMTSMLSPQVLRSQLDSKAVMPYKIWTQRLKRRIDSWFHIYYAKDEFQAFNEIGVEPLFWTFVESKNPLDNQGFHEIPFLQRVWIFKSLCDNIMHNDASIQECFFKTASKDLRPIFLGKDKVGNRFFRIPFFREIRIYKQTKLPDRVMDSVNEGDYYDEFLSELVGATNEVNVNEEDKSLELVPVANDCSLIADSIEGLKTYTKRLRERKLFVLASNFATQIKLLKNDRKSIDGLIALNTQWHEYHNRSQEHFDQMLHLWQETENHKKKTYWSDKGIDQENEIALGKRRTKQKFRIDSSLIRGSDESEESSSYEMGSSDVSDWEETYRKKKKKKLEGKRKQKVQQSEGEIQTPESSLMASESNYDMSDSKIAIQQVISMNDEYSLFTEEKPNIQGITVVKNEVLMEDVKKSDVANALPSSISISAVASKPSVELTVVKKEKDDVICISSDEEDEKVSSKGMVNGVPPKTVPPPMTVPPPKTVPPPIVLVANHVPQPIPVPQPIQLPPVPKPIPLPPTKPPVPQPIVVPQPIMPKKRPVPKPIPEPAWPQPVVNKSPGRVPQPIPATPPGTPGRPWGSPQSPVSSPRGRMISPRLRSPMASPGMRSPMTNSSMRSPIANPGMRSPMTSPGMRTPSPRGLSPRTPGVSSPGRPPLRPPSVARNLFPSQPTPLLTVEGVLEIGQKADGSYGYHVRLPDNGIINLNRQDVEDIRRKHNGVLPPKVEVPLTKNKKF